MSRFSTLNAAARVFNYFKLIGFTSVSIIDGKSVTKPMDVVSMLCSISLGLYICIFSIIRKQDFSSTSKSEIADNGNFITFLMSIVISIISMISAFIFRHKNWRTIVKLDDIEHKVNFGKFAISFQDVTKL